VSQSPNRRQGRGVERAIARRLDVEHVPGEADWYDLVGPTGTKYEVKSTTKTYSGEYSEGDPGRFRLWEDQHLSLVAADRTGTAWYVFVLLDDDEVAAVQKRRPSTVTKIVDDVGDGDWNLAGHSERDSRQQKVPWTAVMDDE
jgi:hypothetical protein